MKKRRNVYFALSHFSYIVLYSTTWLFLFPLIYCFALQSSFRGKFWWMTTNDHHITAASFLSVFRASFNFSIIYAWTIQTRTAEIQLKWHSTFHKVTLLSDIYLLICFFFDNSPPFKKTQTTFSSSLYSHLYVYLVCLQMNTFLALSQHATLHTRVCSTFYIRDGLSAHYFCVFNFSYKRPPPPHHREMSVSIYSSRTYVTTYATHLYPFSSFHHKILFATLAIWMLNVITLVKSL